MVQHIYLKLVGLSNLYSHYINFSVGGRLSKELVYDGTCSICELVLRFFKEYLPNCIDGKLRTYYQDIIDYCLEKLLLYMGYVVHCVAHNNQIKIVLNKSKGDTVVLTVDFIMKFEENRAHESTREHYGKRGLSVHGGMIKYISDNNKVIKQLYFIVLEGDRTQDVKSALAHINIIVKSIREDPLFVIVAKLMILSDNTGTYSSLIFHIAVFNIVASHIIELIGVIHNKLQDGKMELSSWFFHFKIQLHKYVSGTK